MSEEGKKISFGFSKIVKKSQIVPSSLNQVKEGKSSVELIDCFEGKAMKLKNPVKCNNKLLVIPLKETRPTPYNSNKNNSTKSKLAPSTLTFNIKESKIKTFKLKDHTGNLENTVLKIQTDTECATSELPESKKLTLDEIAAKELLDGVKKDLNSEQNHTFSVPLTNNPPDGDKESTLEDYESIPVSDFGIAMLRGMGWSPGKGIGKNEKIFTPSPPTLRPKGMGLGVDKVLKTAVDSQTSNCELKMTRGSFIRVIVGQHKDSYGKIEGFDDEMGRVIVKLSLKNIAVSLNEYMVKLVDEVEFVKNSKVINVSKFEKFKDDERRFSSSDRHSK